MFSSEAGEVFELPFLNRDFPPDITEIDKIFYQEKENIGLILKHEKDINTFRHIIS